MRWGLSLGRVQGDFKLVDERAVRRAISGSWTPVNDPAARFQHLAHLFEFCTILLEVETEVSIEQYDGVNRVMLQMCEMFREEGVDWEEIHFRFVFRKILCWWMGVCPGE
jgi:hypothetical protein